VLYVHTVKPLDAAAVCEVATRTGAVVTCEEHSVIGGLGSAVCEALAEACPTPVARVGLPDTFGQSGSYAQLLEAYSLTAGHVAAAAKRVMSHAR